MYVLILIILFDNYISSRLLSHAQLQIYPTVIFIGEFLGWLWLKQTHICRNIKRFQWKLIWNMGVGP